MLIQYVLQNSDILVMSVFTFSRLFIWWMQLDLGSPFICSSETDELGLVSSNSIKIIKESLWARAGGTHL